MKRRHAEDGRVDAQPSEGEVGQPTLGPEMTVLGRGAELQGSLVSAESIRIDGQAKGTIAARGDVILTSQSQVEADIHAQNVVMGGSLKGNITALTRTELAEGGRLEGTIRSRVLVVQDGALFNGESEIGDDVTNDSSGSGYPEDELATAYDEATRRAADWYRSRLPNARPRAPHASVDRPRTEGEDAPTTPREQDSAPPKLEEPLLDR